MNIRPFAVERYFAEHELAVRHVLCSSDPESFTLKELLSLEPGADEAFFNLKLSYPYSLGTSSLREGIASQYHSIEADNVQVFTGSEEGIFVALNTLFEPGEHVIVQWPCYQSLSEILHYHGCQVSYWHVTEHPTWALDLNALEAMITPKTKGIVVNIPHNPTGYLMGEDDWRALFALADSRGITIFSDEVYRHTEHNPAHMLPAACDLSEHAISLGSLSKAYGLPGLRIGWIATQNKAHYDKIAAFKDYTTICASAPSQFLAEIALRHRQSIFETHRQRVHQNIEHLKRFLSAHPNLLTGQIPKATNIAFLRLTDGLSAHLFCDKVRQETKLMLLPSGLYDFSDQHVRIGFGHDDFPLALSKLSAFCLKFAS